MMIMMMVRVRQLLDVPIGDDDDDDDDEVR